MAVSKKPRKGRAVKHGVRLVDNQRYWLPINQVFLAEYVSGAIAAVSDDCPSDRLEAAIIDPIEMAISHFAGGFAKFYDYWVLIQGLYMYAHLLKDALENQKYKIFDKDGYFPDELNDFAVEHHLKPYREQLEIANNSYVLVIREIGERQRRTGKYGMNGDEMKAMQTVCDNLKELMTWVSVAMLYRAAKSCVDNLVSVETSLNKKLNSLG